MSNVSGDLIWEVIRNQSSFIVQRGSGSQRVTFSREPLNLINKHSRKYSGLANDRAVGVQFGQNGGVTLVTKKNTEKTAHKPASMYNTVQYNKNKTNRKTFSTIVNSTTKRRYRPDLRQEAVARASAIKKSQRPVKPTPESKPRGNKAKKAAAEKA